MKLEILSSKSETNSKSKCSNDQNEGRGPDRSPARRNLAPISTSFQHGAKRFTTEIAEAAERRKLKESDTDCWISVTKRLRRERRKWIGFRMASFLFVASFRLIGRSR